MWSHGICNLIETRALHTSLFSWTCALSHPVISKYLSALREWHLWLHCLTFRNPVQKWCLCWWPLTWIPTGTAAWLEPMFVQALISRNLRCGLMYIPTTLLLYVLKPALHFQCSRFHAFQIEKCVQPCVKTLKICVDSCFCLKLPIEPWLNCFISASVPHLKGILAYSHQEVHSSLGESMCLCALYSKSPIWEVACSYLCITNSRWKRRPTC